MQPPTITGERARALPARAPRRWVPYLRSLPAATRARVVFAGLTVAAVTAFLLVPTYPIYDSQYYLLWGRQILHGQLPSFAVFDGPTEHPLGVAFGIVLGIFDANTAMRLVVLGAVISFLLVAGGVYRLSRFAFNPVVGAVAVALLLTRFDFEFLAARGYIDVTYVAAIVWAAALEVERPRRGTAVFVLLLGAELIRPDAWLLAGVYWLWCFPRASWGQRVGWAAITVSAPIAWIAFDWIVTGQPLFSLHSTQNTAVALGRTLPLAQVPAETGHYLLTLVKTPVVAGAIAGIALSIWFVPRRMLMPVVILICGIGTFVVIAVAGLSVIDRYLLMPSVMLLVFCAFALSGWTMLERGRVRTLWAVAAAALAVVGVYDAASTLSVTKIETELGFRDQGQTSLVQILDKPAVKAALRCGPISVPDHKLRPDVMLLTGRGPGGVIDRNEARYERDTKGNDTLTREEQHGVALYALGLAVVRYAVVSSADDPLDQVPGQLPGFHWLATTQYYAAYASKNC